MIVTGAKCALFLFLSVASNTFFTSVFNFLHIREGTLAIAAPANQSQAHIRTLTLVRIPAALYRWRRIWVRPQRRRVETRPPIFFLLVFHKNQPFGRFASAQIGMKECRQAAAFLVKFSWGGCTLQRTVGRDVDCSQNSKQYINQC